MDGNHHNPDRLLSEPSEFSDQQHERAMSPGAPSYDDAAHMATNGDTTNSGAVSPPVQDPTAKIVHDVLNSEVKLTGIAPDWCGN